MPRIDEYNETTSLSSDDYAILDGRNSGTRKINPDNFVKNTQSFKDLEEFVGYLNSTRIQTIIDDLVDMNEDISTLDGNIGNMENLETEDKSSVVGAVNELKADIGDLSELETDEKSSLVEAINEAANTGGAVDISVSGTSLIINTELTDGNEVSY